MTTFAHSSLWHRPATKLGWWAVGLLAAFVVMFLLNGMFMSINQTQSAAWQRAILPFYGIAMLLCGLASGAVGLVALIRQHERSWLVWLALLPLVFVLFLVLGEFIAAAFGYTH